MTNKTQKTKERPMYITEEQARDLRSKLEAHLDDLLRDIRSQIVGHLDDIIQSYEMI